MACLCEFVSTQTFLSSASPGVLFAEVPAVLLSFVFVVVVKMQAAAVVALTALSVFFGVDCLTPHRTKPNQIQQQDRNAQSNEAGRKKKNQPHILFILTDDQVCV